MRAMRGASEYPSFDRPIAGIVSRESMSTWKFARAAALRLVCSAASELIPHRPAIHRVVVPPLPSADSQELRRGRISSAAIEQPVRQTASA